MSNQRPNDDDFTSVRARRESIVAELSDLRFIGEATAETLAAAEITAELLRDQGVSYLQLVELGVDPGVAARIRREHSLAWSNEPARGARLRRRAQQIRHLRDGERSWINASGGSEGSAPRSRTTPDGSGDSVDAELAWRTRSRRDRPPETRPRSREVPVEPATLTVPELEEAIQVIDDAEVVFAVLGAEREGKARKTAIDAIERRLEALGEDPERDPSLGARGTARARAEPIGVIMDGLRSVVERLGAVEAVPSPDEVPSPAELATRVDERTAPQRAAFGRWVETQLRAVGRLEASARTTSADEWRQLSLGLLFGLVALGALATLVVAVSAPTGSQLSVLSLFLVTVVVGVIAVPLYWWRAVGGGELVMLAALVGLGSVGLIGVVTGGNGSLATTPVALAVFGLVAAALLTTTYLSMPNR